MLASSIGGTVFDFDITLQESRPYKLAARFHSPKASNGEYHQSWWRLWNKCHQVYATIASIFRHHPSSDSHDLISPKQSCYQTPIASRYIVVGALPQILPIQNLQLKGGFPLPLLENRYSRRIHFIILEGRNFGLLDKGKSTLPVLPAYYLFLTPDRARPAGPNFHHSSIEARTRNKLWTKYRLQLSKWVSYAHSRGVAKAGPRVEI